MDPDAGHNQNLDPAFVRDQLDEILAQEITALLDVDSDFAMMSFNLASISCITLIIEREREIKHYLDSPPERYTKESFVKELIDIGLEKDDSLEKTIHSVLNTGYISTDSKGLIKAEMPAFMMMGFLDNMFPGMPGMNLVAFVLQMNEEVTSKRKSLELAKDSFKSILKSRGVAVSKELAEKKASEIASGFAARPDHPVKKSQKLKNDNLNRLSKIIKKRKKRSQDSQGRLNVKDVFDRGPSKEETEVRKAEIKKIEDADKKAIELVKELARRDEKIRTAEAAATEAAQQVQEQKQREAQLLSARKEAEQAAQKASQLEAREAEMAKKEAELAALEARLKQDEQQKQQREEKARQQEMKEEELKKVSQADEDIESRIAAFESELAMPCPLCKDGDVISKTTEKGKAFFSCSKKECRFVSWDKPYHFECPLCKNSFLTETTAPNSEKGLKCPRASCSYTQNNLYDPKQNMAQAITAQAPKKRKRVVRRKRR